MINTPENKIIQPENQAAGVFVAQGTAAGILEAPLWIRNGWQLFKKSPGKLFLMLLFIIFVTIVFSKIPVISIPKLIFPLFFGGIMIACHKLYTGEKIFFKDLFVGFSINANQLCMIGIVYMLVSLCLDLLLQSLIHNAIASLNLPYGGNFHFRAIELLLYLPVVMICCFAPALVTLNNMAAPAAMKTSFLALSRSFPAFLFYVVLLIVLMVAAVIPFASLTSMLDMVELGKGSLMIVGALVLIVFPISLAVVSLIFCSVFMAYRRIFYQS